MMAKSPAAARQINSLIPPRAAPRQRRLATTHNPPAARRRLPAPAAAAADGIAARAPIGGAPSLGAGNADLLPTPAAAADGIAARAPIGGAPSLGAGNADLLPTPAAAADGIAARAPIGGALSLGAGNADLLPTPAAARTYGALDFAALWVGLVVSVSGWYLAGGLVELGFAWWQGVGIVLLGNVITLVPMVLSGAAGAKYGVPFPVLARAAFGVRGAALPAALRALVACGWYGVQTWLGASALHQMLQTLTDGALAAPPLPGLGISGPQAGCFLAFWAAQVAALLKGMEGVRVLEAVSAPALVAMTAALLWWAVAAAGGLGPMLAAPPAFATAAAAWAAFLPALTANVSYWGTLSVSIADFTRYAKSPRAQLVGQALGLPLVQAAFCFVGLAVTSATVSIYGAAVPDPIALLGRLEGVVPITAALVGVVVATLTTNVAANVVAPAVALAAAAPRTFTFGRGALATAAVGLVMQPWRLMASADAFFRFLIGYSCLLAPVAGVVLADYYVLRRQRLNIDALYSDAPTGRYYYTRGWNPAAVAAVAAGAAPTLPGFVADLAGAAAPRAAALLYQGSWFVGFFVGGAAYLGLMARHAHAARLAPARAAWRASTAARRVQ